MAGLQSHFHGKKGRDMTAKLFVFLVMTVLFLVSCAGDKEEEWQVARNTFYQYLQSDTSAAIQQGELVVRLAEKTFGYYSDSTAVAFNNLSALYREIGWYENSYKASEQEYQILSRIGRDIRLADAANMCAFNMLEMGILLPEIEAKLLQARAISDSSIKSNGKRMDKAAGKKATVRIAKICINLAMYYIRTGKIKEAEAPISLAAYICDEVFKFRDMICFDAYLVLVKFYCVSYRNEEAIVVCHTMLDLLKSAEPVHSVNLRINTSYHLLSLAHFQSGQYDSARYYTNLSIKLLQSMEGKQIIEVRNNMYILGRISTLSGHYEEANSLYRKVDSLFYSRRDPNYSDRADMLIDWAINGIALQRYSEARELLTKAKDIYTESLPPNTPRLIGGLSRTDSIAHSISMGIN